MLRSGGGQRPARCPPLSPCDLLRVHIICHASPRARGGGTGIDLGQALLPPQLARAEALKVRRCTKQCFYESVLVSSLGERKREKNENVRKRDRLVSRGCSNSRGPQYPEAITIDERKMSKLGPDHAGIHERSARLPRFVVVLPSFHVLLLVVAYFISCCHRLRSISGGSRLCSTLLRYSSATAGSRRTAASAATGLRPPRRCAARGRRR